MRRHVRGLTPQEPELTGPIRFRVVTGEQTAIYECDREGPGVAALGDLPRELLDGGVLYGGDAGIARRTK